MEPMTDVHAVLLEKEKRRQESMDRVRRLAAAVAEALGEAPVPALAFQGFTHMVEALLAEEGT